MQRHLDWADSAKGLAILGIVAVHTGQRVSGLPSLAARLIDTGRFGVQAFLLVSGLTIFLSLAERARRSQPLPWRTFYLRRFSRIAPVAYAGLLANLLINRPPVTGLGLGLTALFLNGWSPTWFNSLILGGWVLSVLSAFYLVAPLLQRVVRSAASATVLVIASTAAGVGLSWLGLTLRPGWDPAFFYMWPPAQLPVVALGILLYFLTACDEPRVSPWFARGLYAAGAVAVAVVVLGLVPDRLGAQYIYSAILTCGVLALAARPVVALVNPVTVGLGKISYSVFIWHFFVLDELVRLAPTAFKGLDGFAVLFCLAVGVSAGVGWLSYATIERAAARLSARLTPVTGTARGEAASSEAA